MNRKNNNILVWGWLLFIIAVALFLRIYRIDRVPPGVFHDEAAYGLDAVKAARTGNYQLFYPAYTGREGLFINIIALIFKFFGISVVSLRFPAVFFGTLTVGGMYLLAQELFKKERLALLAAYLVAISFWAINFNRIAFRANMLPFILVFSFYFLFRGINTGKLYHYALAGFIFGLGIHTYIAFRVAPLILLVLAISLMLSRENFLKTHWKPMTVFSLLALISALPMLITFYRHPEYLISRSASLSILSPEINWGLLLSTLIKTFLVSLLKYNIVGDLNWRHNYPPYPVLDYLTGLAFLMGIVYSARKSIQLLKARFIQKMKNPEVNIYLFLLAWFFVMLIPEFMTWDGLPHALRSIGTLPPVLIFAALAFEILWEKLEDPKKNRPALRKTLVALLMIVLIFMGVFNAVKYHYFWAGKTETARAFETNLMEINSYLKTIPPQTQKFIITDSIGRVPIKLFNFDSSNLFYFYPSQLEQIKPDNRDFVVVFTEKRETVISELEQKFPGLTLEEKKDSFGLSFYILKY